MGIALPAFKKSEPGNYAHALEVSRVNFAAGEPGEMALNSGASWEPGEGLLVLHSLGHPLEVKYPGGKVSFRGKALGPDFMLQIIYLNYLSRAAGVPLTNEYVTYRDLPGGSAFYANFWQTAIQPLAGQFSVNSHYLLDQASRLGGEIIGGRRSGVEIVFWFLPRVPFRYLAWPGDEEIPGQANILFDSSAPAYLHTEDLAGACIYLTALLQEGKGC